MRIALLIVLVLVGAYGCDQNGSDSTTGRPPAVQSAPDPEPETVKVKVPPRLAANTTRYVHDEFVTLLPVGWEVKERPQVGFEIGFLKTGVPGAHWYLHTQKMPKHAGEPPSDARTLRGMTAQFDRGVKQQYPAARRIDDRPPKLIGKALIHVRYRLEREGRTDILTYDYNYKDGVAYVIHTSCPEAHQAKVQPELDILFTWFAPRKGGSGRRLTHEEVTAELGRTLTTFAATMLESWRPVVSAIEVESAPGGGEATLVINTTWSNPTLVRNYPKFAAAMRKLAEDPGADVEIPGGLAQFIYAVGQLLGFSTVTGDEAKPPIANYAAVILGPGEKRIGRVTISGSDLVRLSSGEVTRAEVIGLYHFE